jgi:hypothetical protein
MLLITKQVYLIAMSRLASLRILYFKEKQGQVPVVHWEAEIGRTAVGGQPRQIIQEIPALQN